MLLMVSSMLLTLVRYVGPLTANEFDMKLRLLL